MKKTIVFIPAILFSLLYVFLIVAGAGSVSIIGFIVLDKESPVIAVN